VELSAWLRQQITINGGTVHVRRDGAEEPIGAEELVDELARRLDGLTFHMRLIVDSHSQVEALGFVQSHILSGVERLAPNHAEIDAPIETRLKRRGPKSEKLSKVLNEMMARLRAGKCTLEGLRGYSQAKIRRRFGCSHQTFEAALALIADPIPPDLD
jgi:hypothetical protein